MPGRMELRRSAAERDDEKILWEWCGTISQPHASCGVRDWPVRTTRGSPSPVGSFTGDMPSKAQTGAATTGDDRFGTGDDRFGVAARE